VISLTLSRCCRPRSTHRNPSLVLQNDVKELFSLLTLIDPRNYSDVLGFVKQFGELRGASGEERGV
jgi:hypothetical protein